MYRFRSVENLIGEFQELEKQQIYFADLDELNDPLEGKYIYFWKGDIIIWENFLKHYILCLERMLTIVQLADEDKTISKKDIPIYISFNDLPTDIYKGRIKKIYNKFFGNKFVQEYIKFITSNPNKIYKDEVYVHLKILFMRALNSIILVDREYGLNNINIDEINMKEINIDFEDTWWDELDGNKYNKLIDAMRDTLKTLDDQLLFKYRDSPKLQSIYIEFTQMYLDAVVQLTYPKVYVACFMDNCFNSSIWGTYGNNHTGVCLRFKTDSNNPVLTLKGIHGFSTAQGYIKKYMEFPLEKIEYSMNFNEIDFFSSLGCLSKQTLKEQWYTNDNGDISICSMEVFTNENEWRKQYWGFYHNAYLKKLSDWEHEREYRIVLDGSLGYYSEPKDRVLEYRFEDLEEIIFGMKISKDDKMKIIEIIKNKCNKYGREDFRFYQMDYSDSENKFYKREINLGYFKV